MGAEILNSGGLAGARSLQLWLPRLSSADVQVYRERETASARVRELGHTSAYASNVKRIHRDNVIGPRFTFVCRPDAKLLGISQQQATEIARLYEREWAAYAESITFDADAARVCTFSSLMGMAYSGFMDTGESLAVLKFKPGHGGFGTCMLMIEPERLSNPPHLVPGPRLRNGIETDRDGAPIAYHIRNSHPSDAVFGEEAYAASWSREERATEWGRPRVLHMIDRTRPDMRRGITMLASIISSLKMVEGMDESELEAGILRSSLAAVLKTNLTTKDAMGIMGATEGVGATSPGALAATSAIDYWQGIAPLVKETQLTMGGARVTHLLPQEELQLLKAGGEGLSYEAFQNAVLRKLAAGAGVSVEQLSRDFSKMTFAAAQMSLRDVWRHFICKREMVVRYKAIPFVGAWMEEAIDTRRLPLPTGKLGTLDEFLPMRNAVLSKSTFMSWGPPKVDPEKEARGTKLELDLGRTTLQEQAFENGQDYEELLEQRRIEIELQAKFGMPPSHELDQPPPPPEGEGEGPPAPAKK